MVAPSPLVYIIGVLLVTLFGLGMGFIGRLFLAGVRQQVVSAVVNTAMGAVLGNIEATIQDVKADVTLIKTSQQTTSQTFLLLNQDLSAMRTRLESHLTSDEDWQDRERSFNEHVTDFMDWAGEFLKNHMHVGASASVADLPPNAIKRPPLTSN